MICGPAVTAKHAHSQRATPDFPLLRRRCRRDLQGRPRYMARPAPLCQNLRASITASAAAAAAPLGPPRPSPSLQLPRHATIACEELSVPALPALNVEPLRVPSEPLRWLPKLLQLPSVPPAADLAMPLGAEAQRLSPLLSATGPARSVRSWWYLQQRFILQ